MQVKTILKIVLVLVVVSGVGFFTYRVGVLVGEENILRTPPSHLLNQTPDDELAKVDFSIFWEAWRKLEKKFLEQDKIDYQQMVYGAIEGMVNTLDDPYTVFFTPQKAESFKEELSGKYEGVGMYVGIKKEQLTVVSPISGTPADQAGLKAGDKILQIDDTYTLDLAIDEAVSLIKGPRGTFVRLLIQRDSFTEPKEFVVKRDKIKIPTLEWEIVEEGIALIKMYQFNEILTSEFSKAAIEIIDLPVDKIIIDLRNNPGGYLEVAQNIGGWFIKKGEVIVWQDQRNEEKEDYRSGGPAVFENYSIAVLINEGSASASEILAGALRDHLGAKLVGEKSFGKGSVQEQLTLSDNSSLKVTIAKWLTPDGNLIDGEGLAPDFEVIMPEQDELEIGKDPQLEKAIEILK